MTMTRTHWLYLLVAFLIVGCSAAKEPPPPKESAEEEPLPPPVYESALPEDMRSGVNMPFTGDYDAMVRRRLIRVGVTFNRTFYFVDKGAQRGLAYEYLHALRRAN